MFIFTMECTILNQILIHNVSGTISQLRPFFTSLSEKARKYRDDLFLLAPFYHRVFPFDRFIMLDVDLKFKIGIEELYKEFDNFEVTNIMGVASDLSPHYMHALREYRAINPNTHIGEPGRFQVNIFFKNVSIRIKLTNIFTGF